MPWGANYNGYPGRKTYDQVHGRPVVGLPPNDGYPGRDTLARVRGGYGSAYNAAPGRAVVGLAPPKQKTHHGLLGSIIHNPVTHTLGKVGSDAVSIAEHAPGGIYDIGHTVYEQTASRITGDKKRQAKADAHSAALAKATVKQTATDLRHPLRHPGYTLLDVLGIAGGVGGAAARGGAAAAKLGEEGSIAARLGRAAAAASKKPNPAPRLVSHDGLTVKLPASPNPVTRAAQHAFDRLRESFPDVPVLGAAHVVGKENARNIRYASQIARAPVDALVAKAKHAGLLKQSVPGRYTQAALVKQHALRVAAEEVPVPERIAFHEKQLAKGHKAAAQTDQQIAAMRERDFVQGHRQQIRLNSQANTHLAHEQVPLADYLRGKIRDLGGRGVDRAQLEQLASRAAAAEAKGETITLPRLNDPQLAEVYGQLLKVAGSREGVLQELDKLQSGQIVGRLSAPGRVLLGARFEAPKRAVDLATVKVGDRVYAPGASERGLVTNVDRAAGKVTVSSYDRRLRRRVEQTLDATSGPDANAQARLAELDRSYNELVQSFVPETSPYANRQAEQLRRNFENSRAGKGKRVGVRTQPTVSAEEFQRAETAVHDVIARNPKNPAAQKAAQLIAERQQLRDMLNARGEASIFGGAAPDLPAKFQTAPTLTARGDARLVGAEDFAGGAARIPTVPAFKGARSSKVPPNIGSSAGIADVRDLPSLTHPYTGAAYKAGKIRTDVVRLMAESGLEAQRYWTLLHVADELRQVAKPLPTSKYDVPVRLERLPGQESLATVVKRIEEQGHVPEGLLAQLSHAYDGVRQLIFPDYNPETRIPVDPVPGVGFVDERLLGGLNKPSPLATAMAHGWIRGSVKVVDTLNNASKLAILYLKPAYLAPNLLGNVSLNLVQQGFAAPRNLYHAARLNAQMGPDTAALVDAAMGEGVAASLDHYSGRFVSAAAQKWSRLVDAIPRRAAFLYEARRAGYRTPQQISKLLTDHDLADTLNQVQRHANAAIIDYGNLGPIERSIVRRIFFFFPWVKGSTVWSVHFLADHPAQAGAVGQLSRIGEEQQTAALGDLLPSWAEGLIPVGTGAHGLPETINPAGTSVLATPAEVVQLLAGLAGHVNPDESIASNLTPALTFAQTAATKGVGPALQGLYENLPEVLAVQRARGERPSKTFPSENNPRTALLQFLLSTGLVPRETNPNELRAGYFAQRRPRP